MFITDKALICSPWYLLYSYIRNADGKCSIFHVYDATVTYRVFVFKFKKEIA